jgi:hypothetical protein
VPTDTPVPPTADPTATAGGPGGNPFSGGPGVPIAFPNPAQGAQTRFGFSLDASGSATISVWTAAGVLASTVADHFGPGNSILRLNIKDYAPGVYLDQLVIHYDDGRTVTGPLEKFVVIP